MDRRAFLATSAAALPVFTAGCSDRVPGSTSSSDPSENTTDDSPPNAAVDGPWQPFDSLPNLPDSPPFASFETAPLTVATPTRGVSTNDRFRLAVRSIDGATADAPARIEAVISNRQPFEQTIRSRRLLLLDSPTTVTSDDQETVYLAPAENHPLAEQVPEYTQDEHGRWRLTATGDDWYPDQITAPGNSGFIASYYLLGQPDEGERPVEPGRYQTSWRGDPFTVAVWPTDQPGPAERSALVGTDVPPLHADRQIEWFHEATEQTEAYLQPGRESVSLPAAIDATFINRSTEPAGGNPHYWRLHKLVDDEWYPVEPWGWTQPYHSIPPGGNDHTRLALFNDNPIDGLNARTVGYIGGGRYAYEIAYSVGEQTHAFCFDVDASDITIAAPADAVFIEGGAQQVIELPDYSSARRPTTVTIERWDVAPPEDRIIPEQLPRETFVVYRTALSQFTDGVEEVAVKTSRSRAPRTDSDETSTQFEYEGETYEVKLTVEDA